MRADVCRAVRGAAGRFAAPVAAQFDAATRARRWEWFREAFPDIDKLRVVDLGGSADFWLHAPVRPAHVEVVGADAAPRRVLSWLELAGGDPVTYAPAGAGAYDLVLCDGLLEADSGRREALAGAVRGLAARYWVRAAGVRRAELARLFPDAVLRRERRGGLVVSHIAAKPR
ncbi:hypothetical protein [Yinghuangia sp. YIM S09857]|uniref:hypothetical protein n=1 Tax=Yinghuangia sp. YIM S09857 TaxID=3436929 RepID=UPI003F537C92